MYVGGVAWVAFPDATWRFRTGLLLAGVGMALAFIVWIIGVQAPRAARVTWRRMAQLGEDVPRQITVRRTSAGLGWSHQFGELEFAWSSVRLVRQRKWWVLRFQGSEVFRFPDRDPVPELLAPPATPAPLPPMPEGTRSWPLRSEEYEAVRTFGATQQGPGTRVSWWVFAGFGAAALGVAMADFYGLIAFRPAPIVGLLGVLLLFLGFVARSASRRVRWLAEDGTELSAHFAEVGITSAQPGVRRFTPWSSVRDWQQTATHLGLRIRGNNWIVAPLSGVPDVDQARQWYDAAPTSITPRPPLTAEVPTPERENPFEPPR